MTNSKSKFTIPKSTAEVIDGLEAARQKKPDLAGTIDLHRALLEVQGQVAPVSLPTTPTAEEIEEALQQGMPLLHLVPLSFDWAAVSQLAADTCRIVAEHRPDLASDLATVSRYLADQNRQIEPLVTRYLNDESLDIAVDEGQPPDQDLLTFILNHTLRPFLQSAIQNLQPYHRHAGEIENPQSETLAPALRSGASTGVRNPKSTCPVCGGPPDFAALVSGKDNEGYGRRLLCARCDTEWGYQRGGCPFCGQTGQWAYFPDENEVFRLYVCDSDACYHYLKTVDWRQTFAHRSLPVARVITVDMDLAARQAGYR